MNKSEMQLREDCRLLEGLLNAPWNLSSPYGNQALLALERLQNAALKNTQSEQCKCMDHTIAYAAGQWEKPIRLSIRNGHLPHTAHTIPMVFNHCPECGRKLKK